MSSENFLEKVPLTESYPVDPSDDRQAGFVTVVRPNKGRRYRLLSNNRLKVPNGHPRTYDYTKHMPLITIDSDEEDSEEFDTRMYDKVSNQNLNELLKKDRSEGPTGSGERDGDDDWDLNLIPPTQHRTRCACPQFTGCPIL
ncbi:unnamed protein product [Calicophoron daubneyi]|uniref:Uncharacterized protein n=1 Tax=Calicophoron daubneyi TaxID=300641 RepID=A0AAV2TX13_CALDB